jgi:hypothetical protein
LTLACQKKAVNFLVNFDFYPTLLEVNRRLLLNGLFFLKKTKTCSINFQLVNARAVGGEGHPGQRSFSPAHNSV